MGLGHRFEFVSDKPYIISQFGFKGNSTFHTAFFRLSYNSLDKTVFPRIGVQMEGELARVFTRMPMWIFYTKE